MFVRARRVSRVLIFFFFFFIASGSSRLPIRQSSIENIYVYYMRTNHLIIIELFAHITAHGRVVETQKRGERGYRSN